MRVVLDTNVLVSGIFWSGIPGRILELWAGGGLTVCASAGIMEEYFEVIDRLTAKCGKSRLAGKWKVYLFEHCELIEPTYHSGQCRDPDDAKFIECAVSAGARCIVSGDDDLLSLGSVEAVPILSPADFLQELGR